MATGLERSVFIPIPKKGKAKECSNYRTIALILLPLIAQLVNHLPAMQETQVLFLGQEDSLEKETATHSSILAWRISWTEKPDGLHTVHGVTKSQTRLSN